MHPIEAAALDELFNAEIQQGEQTSDETNSVKGITETEIQQVEPNIEADSVKGKEVSTITRRTKPPLNFIAFSRQHTNSVKGITETEIQQVEQISEADSVKGKEVTTTKRRTKPPLNFIAIWNEAKIKIDSETSSPDKLRDQLYAGVFLEPKKLKYFVDKKFNTNCFVVFARKLVISWSDNIEYWKWTEEKDTSGEDIEVAELTNVCWLDIQGKIRTMNFSLRTVYEVVFVVKIDQCNIWKDSVTLTIILPNSKTLTREENLSKRPSGNWIEIQVGEFKTSPEIVGEITFKLEEHSSAWKRGIIVKCAIIRPKIY